MKLQLFSLLLAAAGLAAPAAAQWGIHYLPSGAALVQVPAQPQEVVFLLVAPALGQPIALPGVSGMLLLDLHGMVVIPGAPVDARGLSVTALQPGGPYGSLAPWLQPGIVSPRDPASGLPVGKFLPPKQLLFRQ